MDGTFVKEWCGADMVEKEIGFDSNSIRKCCNRQNNHRSAFGYIWVDSEYYYSKDFNLSSIIDIRDNSPIKVCQLDKDLNILTQYDSIRSAATQTGIKYQNIAECCAGKRKTAGGYIWRKLT